MKQIRKAIFALSTAATVLMFLFGCGGGGSSDGSTTPLAANISLGGTENLSPVANAGPGQTAALNSQVSLNGSQSYDPDENYPLTFAWNLKTIPPGSTAQLSADGQYASFVIDKEGEYEVELTVTDQKGSVSAPVTVVISTLNSAPVAAAGLNQYFQAAGTLISLDGSQSYDPDPDDAITYEWVMTGKPVSSAAVLSAETSVNPTFVADLLGTYTVDLIVTDPHGLCSAVASVIVTSDNLPPVANAGINQVVLVGENVVLDGSASFDANMDVLTYHWSISAKPEASLTELSDADQQYAYFTPDKQGVYTVNLVVNDELFASAPQAVDILAIDEASMDDFIRAQMDAIDALNALPDSAFQNVNYRTTLITKIMSILVKYLKGTIDQEMVNQLKNDVAAKMDSCMGGQTQSDWIIACDAQATVYPLIEQSINSLQALIDGMAE